MRPGVRIADDLPGGLRDEPRQPLEDGPHAAPDLIGFRSDLLEGGDRPEDRGRVDRAHRGGVRGRIGGSDPQGCCHPADDTTDQGRVGLALASYSLSVLTCPSCGQANPEGFKLCGMCGAALASSVSAAGRREERKVVSVLFCDLVGFTQRAERLDPEDVRAILGPYHARVRQELERHGGTVEKFIGDAVMALFGAPIAHEDDPERAVRAALAIREFASDQGIELRVGIATGEVLVSLDARPSEGEGMASGDVVNTAARLQSAAPINGVLVDETTHRATRHAIDYGDAPPVEAKGKARPVPVWQALQVRARLGVDVAHDSRSELVGREHELAVLRDALARVRSAETSQLVTLIGVPGIGKSRLLFELSALVEADPELITWRQGRCLAYGDGVTLWALTEIVKAQAGIHEQDADALARQKLTTAVRDLIADEADASWVESHLLALLGLATQSQLGGDRRGEAFSAWRRFFDAMGEQRPTILVFEDLHWADASLLDFVDELVDWVADVPLLVVATARPELLERRPDWGGGKLNATTLALQPLTDEETARLIGQRLGDPTLADSQRTLLERAGGNPLYAEQFAELFLERGAADLSLPETLQGIIAARLDGLPAAEKELLRDASVAGKVFWSGSIGGDTAVPLHALERKGFVRRQRRTSVEGETEYAFAHALVRDVAYGQLARADRAGKHQRMAQWLESLGRPDDHAEMLAHHWRSALELRGAALLPVEDLLEPTRLALRAAGDRAFDLNAFLSAERYLSEALDLWPADDPERPDLKFRWARALHLAGDDRREPALTEARDALLAAGATEQAAEAEAFLSEALWFRGQRDLAYEHLAHAEELLAGVERSLVKSRILVVSGRYRMLAGDLAGAERLSREALATGEALGLDEIRVRALTTIGSSITVSDRELGLRTLEEALEIARASNSPLQALVLNNLGFQTRDDVERANELYRQAAEVADRFGDQAMLRFVRGNVMSTNFQIGRWDEALTAADAFISESASSPHYSDTSAHVTRAIIRLGRGDAAGAIEDLDVAVGLARASKDLQVLLPPLVASGFTHSLLGRVTAARTSASEAINLALANAPWALELWPLIWFGDQLGIADAVYAAIQAAPDSPMRSAVLAALDGDDEPLTRLMSDIKDRAGDAYVRLMAAERFIGQGRRAEGEAELAEALAFYRGVGATFYIERGEALRAKSA